MRGEFAARLEGAEAALEAALAKADPELSEFELASVFRDPGRKLLFEGRLIDGLDPPAGCAALQEKAAKELTFSGEFETQLLKNLTPLLKRQVPSIARRDIATLRRFKAESRSCA